MRFVRRLFVYLLPWTLGVSVAVLAVIAFRGWPLVYGGLGAAAILAAIVVERELGRVPTGETVGCSFCKRTRVQVKYLVAGPDSAAICDECVKLSSDILAQAGVAPTGAPMASVPPPDGPTDPWEPPAT